MTMTIPACEHSYAGVQAFQIMTLASVGSNLITYVLGELHFPLSQAANVVTNFVGAAFLVSLLGGFLSDSYLGCFWTLLTFAGVELSVITFIVYLQITLAV
jgi:dipeptide/tripeptide permease